MTLGTKALIAETSARQHSINGTFMVLSAQDEGCSGPVSMPRAPVVVPQWIDRPAFILIWQEAYRHQLELRKDARELGDGAVKRVEEDLARAAKILMDLGIQVGDHDVRNLAN